MGPVLELQEGARALLKKAQTGINQSILSGDYSLNFSA